jgi:predicted transcriptional regulator
MSQASNQSITLSVRVSPELREQLEGLSGATGRTKSFLTAEALRNYLEIHAWQVQAIETAIKEADSGKAKFADHDQVVNWLKTWGSNKKKSVPKCK